MSVTWYVRSRGTTPERDYTWADRVGDLDSPSLRDVTEASKSWLAPSSASFVVGSVANVVTIYAGGLRNNSWPRDFQGRDITASLVLLADHVDAGAALAVAGSLIANGPPADLVTFDPDGAGWSPNPEAIRALLDAEPANPPVASPDRQCIWTPSRHQAAALIAGLDTVLTSEATRDFTTRAVVSELLTRDSALPLVNRAYVLCGSHLPSQTVERPKVGPVTPSPTPAWARLVVPAAALLGLLAILWLVWAVRRRG